MNSVPRIISCILIFSSFGLVIDVIKISGKERLKSGFYISSTKKPEARDLIKKSIEVVGGEEKLRLIKSVKFRANAHQFLLEQSERPTGLWLVSYQQIIVSRNLEKKLLRRELTTIYPGTTEPGKSTVIVADGIAADNSSGSFTPGLMAQVEDAEESFAFAPERLLLTALDGKNLRSESDVVLQDRPHRVVSFQWKDAACKLFLNSETSFPTAIEITRARPYDFFWNIWGNFPVRTYFSFWTLESNGLRYPHQLDEERNGQMFQSTTVSEIEFNQLNDPAVFEISDEVRRKFQSAPAMKISDWNLGLPNLPPAEIAPGFIQIPGRWNVEIVKQTDGIIILEAPITSAYSAKVIDEVRRLYPGDPIKAVISTSDAFPHLGGVREYIGRGIPVYILDVNQPIIEKLLNANYASFPDALQKNGRKAKLNIVKTKTVVGSGANRLEIYPIRTESGERMLMIYAPEYQLLYGSDLVQPVPGGKFFMPQYLTELKGAVSRENLKIQKIIAIHSRLREWSEIENAISLAEGSRK